MISTNKTSTKQESHLSDNKSASSRSLDTFSVQSLRINHIFENTSDGQSPALWVAALPSTQSTSSSSGLVGHRRRSALSFSQTTNQAKWVIIDLISQSKNIKSPEVSSGFRLHEFICSRLDDCNAVVTESIRQRLVQNTAAARVFTKTKTVDHISPALRSLHRLPACPRIYFMILLFVYKALTDLRPETFLMCCDFMNRPELSDCPGQASLLSLQSKLNTEM